MALALRVGGCRALTTRTLCHIAPSSTTPASHFSLPLLSAHTPQPCLLSQQLTQGFALSNQGLGLGNPGLRLSSKGHFQNLVTRASDGEAAAVSVEDAPLAEPPAAKPEAEASPVELLDFRVGRVLKAWKHPEADGLFVEEVDVGEEDGPRTIVSGLVGYVPLEEMQDRPVVVFANLKPRNMRGIKSNGMLVAASNADHTQVELVTPPMEAQPGERIWFGGEGDPEQAAAAGANQVQKKKIWEGVQPKLNTSDDLKARFGDRIMRTSAGPCTVKSLKGARLS